MATIIFTPSMLKNGTRGVPEIPAGSTPPVFNNTYSLAFDGVDDNLYIGTSLNLGTNSTVSLWIKRGRSSAIEVVLSEDSYAANYLFEIGSNQLWFRIDSVYLTFQSAAIKAIINNNTTNWTHICFVRSGDSVELFLNGNSMQVQTGVGSVIDTRFDRIGSWYNATYAFQGNIDEVSGFNSALTSSDITDIYNSGTPTDLTSLNPVAWYRNGDNGTFKSPQWLIPNNENKNKFSNYSFLYDGVDDFVEIGSPTSIQSLTSEITISFWIKAPRVFSTNYYTPLSKGEYAAVGSQWSIQVNTANLRNTSGGTFTTFSQAGAISGRENLTFPTPVDDNQWHHMMFVNDGTDLKIYLDGQLEATGVGQGGTLYDGNRSLKLGQLTSTSNTGLLKGNLDEVAIFGTALGLSDAEAIYNSGVPSDLASLSPVGYWRSEQSIFTDNWLVDNSALSNYSTRSFAFDGVDDYITISNPILSSAGDMTISSWANFSSLAGVQGIFDSANFYRSGFNGGFSFRSIGTNLNVGFSNGTVFDAYGPSTGLSTSGGWYHLAFTFNNTTKLGTFYVNGSLIDTHTYTAGFDNADLVNGGEIGRAVRINSYCFTGLLDEIAIFNSELSASDITSLYNGGEPARIEGAVAHWRMGEDATFNTNWNVPDQVGSATGTSANMTIADLQGDAPNYTGGGLSNNMTIEDRVGDASNSSNNAVSFNMDEVDRETDVPS